jgi:hypothetical protein
MTERVQEVVRHGRWLYDAQLLYDVWILRQNYIDDPGADEGEQASTPWNDDGYLFFAAYGRNRKWTGISNTFRTEAEAVAEAERTIHQGIEWDR